MANVHTKADSEGERERERTSNGRKRGLVEIKRASQRQRCVLSWAGYKYLPLYSSPPVLSSLLFLHSTTALVHFCCDSLRHRTIKRAIYLHGNSDRILQWQQRWNNGNESPTLFEEGTGWSTSPTDYFLVSWQHTDRVSHMPIIVMAAEHVTRNASCTNLKQLKLHESLSLTGTVKGINQ